MKTKKPKNLLVGMVSMSDLMFSLSAGLLVMGISSLVDPDYERDYAALVLEVQTAQRRLALLQEAAQRIDERYQALIQEEKREFESFTKSSVSLGPRSNSSQPSTP